MTHQFVFVFGLLHRSTEYEQSGTFFDIEANTNRIFGTALIKTLLQANSHPSGFQSC